MSFRDPRVRGLASGQSLICVRVTCDSWSVVLIACSVVSLGSGRLLEDR